MKALTLPYRQCSQTIFSARKISFQETAFAGRHYVSRVCPSLGLLAYPLFLPLGWTPHSRKIHPHPRQGCSHPDHPLCGLRRTASFLLGFCALSLRDLPGRSTLKTGGQAARWRSHLTRVRSTALSGRGASDHSFALGRSRTPGCSARASHLRQEAQTRPVIPSLGRLHFLRRRSRSILPERANLRIGPAAGRGSFRSHWTCSRAARRGCLPLQSDLDAACKNLASRIFQQSMNPAKWSRHFAGFIESTQAAEKIRAYGASIDPSCSSTTGQIWMGGAA